MPAPIEPFTRDRIRALARDGHGPRAIERIVKREGLQASVGTISNLLAADRKARAEGKAPPAPPPAQKLVRLERPRPAAAAPVAPPAPPSSPAPAPSRPALPVELEVDRGPWGALREILDALAPELVAEVEAGLEAYAAGGMAGLGGWLVGRPARAPAVPPVDAGKVAEVRRIVAKGDFDATTIPRLADGLGVDEATVRALLTSAATAATKDALPLGLAVEESIGVMSQVRQKALEASDYKAASAAQMHIDKVRIFSKKLTGAA